MTDEKHYPRKGEYGEPVQRCEWCGKPIPRSIWKGPSRYCSSACAGAGNYDMSLCAGYGCTICAVIMLGILLATPSFVIFSNIGLYSNLVIAVALCIILGPALIWQAQQGRKILDNMDARSPRPRVDDAPTQPKADNADDEYSQWMGN